MATADDDAGSGDGASEVDGADEVDSADEVDGEANPSAANGDAADPDDAPGGMMDRSPGPTATGPGGKAPRRLEGLSLLLLLVVTAAVFAVGLTAGFVWDDWILIVRNEFVRDPAQLGELLTSTFWNVSSQSGVERASYLNFYRPVVTLAYATEFQLFGESPLGFHAVSYVLHLLSVSLVFVWLRRRLADDRPASPSRSRGHSPAPTLAPAAAGALAGAALFALHPSRPETVTWISGSTDLWMTFWILVALLAFEQPRRLTRGLGGLAVALAALSKESAFLLPPLLLADSWLRGRRPTLSREGYAGIGAAVALALHLWFVPPVLGAEGGAPVAPSHPIARVLASLGHFLARAVWPLDPSVEPVPRTYDGTHEVFAGWSVALGALGVVAIGLLLVLALRSRGGAAGSALEAVDGDGSPSAGVPNEVPLARAGLADALWFLAPLLPVLNLLPLQGPTVVSDRYLYFPLLGLASLLARGVSAAARRGGGASTLAAAATLVTALALGAITARHVARFDSDEELFAHELERNPASHSAANAVALAARLEGDHPRAIALYAEGARLAVEAHRRDDALDLALRALVVQLSTTSDAEEARLRAIRDALDGFAREPRLRVDLPPLGVNLEMDPRFWANVRDASGRFQFARAAAHARLGSLEVAMVLLGELLTRDPRHGPAWNLLVAIHGRAGQWGRAAEALDRARRSLPGEPALEETGARLERARALAGQPASDPETDAIRRARVQRELGSPRAARAILDAALSSHPLSPRLVLERAQTDLADGRVDLARAGILAARDQDPARRAQWERALGRLEAAYAARGPGADGAGELVHSPR